MDVHTHFDLADGGVRTCDDWQTGTIAAACGGTTTVVNHPGFGPPECSIFHQIDASHRRASESAAVDYSFHGLIQHAGSGLLDDLGSLLSSGISSCKVYLTYEFRLSDRDLLRVFDRMERLDLLTAVHCESHEVIDYLDQQFKDRDDHEPWFYPLSRPSEAEAEAVARTIRLAEVARKAPLYVVHLSTKEGLAEIQRARARGLPVYAETCPQYLLLTDERYKEPENDRLKYIMSPPLRKPHDALALWLGLADRAIDVVATDHCPLPLSTKKEFDSVDRVQSHWGIPGVETRMALMFSEGIMKGKLSFRRFVEVTSSTPARLMGLYPKKGIIASESDADFVIRAS